MSSMLMKGIIRGGRVEVTEPINLPDGSAVTITSDGNALGPDGWSEAKNERRCSLIRKKFSQGIDASEIHELAELQGELAAYRERTTPLPFDVLDELRAALNASAATAS